MSVAISDPRTLGLTFADRLLFSLNDNLDLDRANEIIFNQRADEPFSLDDIGQLPPHRLDKIDESDLKRLCQAVATAQHESRHVQQASNTTAGFLLAMTQRQLAVSILQSLNGFAENGVKEIRIPLLSPESLESVKPRKAMKEVREAVGILAAMNQQLLDFASASPITVAEALENDRKLERLRPGSSLQLRSKLPDDAPVAPNELRLIHLLEADANAADSAVLSLARMAGVPSALLTQIINELAADDTYTYAKNIFLHYTNGRYQRGPFLTQFVAALNVAMSPTVFRGEPNLLEDVLPAWRFVRICEVLESLEVPDDSLENYAEFGEAISAALGWDSPMNLMVQTAQDNRWADLPDPIMKDLFSRRKYFCAFVTQSGVLPLLYGSTPVEFFDRFMPWAIKAKDRLVLVNYPKNEMSVEAAGFALMQHALGEDALFASNLSNARRFFQQLWGHLVKRGDWTEERLEFELQEYIDSLVTHDGRVVILETQAT